MSSEKVQVGKTGWEKDALREVVGNELRNRQGETLSVLDQLRRTRISRGGVGAPLQVPAHLSAGSEIIITDAALNDGLVAKPLAPPSDE